MEGIVLIIIVSGAVICLIWKLAFERGRTRGICETQAIYHSADGMQAYSFSPSQLSQNYSRGDHLRQPDGAGTPPPPKRD